MQYKPNLPENQANATSVLAKGYEADLVFWPKNPKANFRKAKMNVTTFLTKEYEKISNCSLAENKPNTKPIKANLLNAQMNVNKVLTRDYENKSNWAICENKANFNPTCRVEASGVDGNKPNLSRRSLWRRRKQTQTKPTCSELVCPERTVEGVEPISEAKNAALHLFAVGGRTEKIKYEFETACISGNES